MGPCVRKNDVSLIPCDKVRFPPVASLLSLVFPLPRVSFVLPLSECDGHAGAAAMEGKHGGHGGVRGRLGCAGAVAMGARRSAGGWARLAMGQAWLPMRGGAAAMGAQRLARGCAWLARSCRHGGWGAGVVVQAQA